MDATRLEALEGSRSPEDSQQAETASDGSTTTERLPWNHLAILQDAGDSVKKSSPRDQQRALQKGVPLHGNTQMYRVIFSKNWFTLLPRGLKIAWDDNTTYWKWKTLRDKDGTLSIEAAILEQIRWLDISGKFQTVRLSPDTDYEIVLHIKLEKDKWKFDDPVKFKVRLPNGETLESSRKFKKEEAGSWKDISLHCFQMSTKLVGDLEFCIYEHGNDWKQGLVIGGVSLRPTS